MSSFIAFSYEKFVLDDEMCGMMRQYVRGIEVTPETLGFDVIASVGHGGHFLGHKQTLARCRTEFWQPDLVDRNGIEAFMRNGQSDAGRRARKRWQKLLAEHQDPPLDDLVARQLKTYVETQTQTHEHSSVF